MTLRFGRYEAVGKLGEGAMAAVHLARDPVLDRLVAVKVLHRNVAAGRVPLQRFFNEAKTVARLANPHVVEVFDFGKQGREYYLVMEYVDGRSLGGMLLPPGPEGKSGAFPAIPPVLSQGRPGRPLPDDITVSLLCQAAEGLDMAARHGVVHRDIKPENLMINSQGYLKVADFGIAHLQDDSLTRTGAVLGSPLYMSPEQVRGAKPITSQSDMFSLGAVFYRCLTGFPPFESATLKELFRKIAQEAPAPLALVRPDLDPALARLVGILLQKDPSRRGEGPRWLRAELRAWLFSRGMDDPMERVHLHMRELSMQSGSAPAFNAGAVAYRDGSTVRDPSAMLREPGLTVILEPGMAGTMPLRGLGTPGEGTETSRRVRAGWPMAASLGALAVSLGAGISLWFGAGTGNRGSMPRNLENRPSPTSQAEPAYANPVLPEWTAAGEATVAEVPVSAENSAGEALEVAHVEERASAGSHEETGILEVHTAPPFAQVFIDGNAMGVAPVTLSHLTPGPHRLLVRSRFGASLDTLLQVEPGKRILRMKFSAEAVALESPE